MLNKSSSTEFRLRDQFLNHYSNKEVPWGFGDLSWITYKRTYSRGDEDWWQTCQRVIEGMFTIQKTHCMNRGLPWKGGKATQFAEDAYDRLFNFKWTPPGRGLWIMGTDFIFERTGAPLNNCGFTSTKDIDRDYAKPFMWMLQMSMLGVGVGYDTRGKGKVKIQPPSVSRRDYVIGDSREGWAQAIGKVLRAFQGEDTLPNKWDYSEIRPKGAPIKSFGGVASGPEPLRECMNRLTKLYHEYTGEYVDSRLIVDTFNLIAKCVVAGGTRRSALLSLGEAGDKQFMDLKADPEKVQDYRWASNNSIRVERGHDYTDAARRTVKNGEPGYVWLDNARDYGRMADAPDFKDSQALGVNPCSEQILCDKELCTLVETYPAHHKDYTDFQRTLKIAYQYGKTVTLVNTHSEETNQVMLRNRRIGCSVTGIVQAINKHGYRNFMDWCDSGYHYIEKLDEKYSDWLGVPQSVRKTTVKPSGTVSLLAGATAGVHWPHSEYYVRRMRAQEGSEIVELCREAGYPIEDDEYSDNTKVIEFPVHVDNIDRSKSDVSVREKVDLAAQMQRYWSDNSVSCTAEFDPSTTEPEDINRLLEMYEDRLKSISFLPSAEHGYEQPVYEEIQEPEYRMRSNGIEPINRDESITRDREDKFCDGKQCEIEPEDT